MPVHHEALQLVEPSATARRLWWHVLSLGRAWRDEPERHEGQDKAGLFLFWIVSGSGELRHDGQLWPLAPGPRCWLADMAAPRIYVPGKNRKLATCGIRFNHAALDAWREVLLPGEFAFASRSKALAAFIQAYETLAGLVARRPAGWEWQVHETLTRVVGALIEHRKAWPSTGQPVPPPVKRVLDTVLASPLRAWRAAELAEVARVSYSGLRALFRQVQQETLQDFLQRTRLDQARLLLADSRLSIKEAARRLDFRGEDYFSHWFRRHTGQTPSAFREVLLR